MVAKERGSSGSDVTMMDVRWCWIRVRLGAYEGRVLFMGSGGAMRGASSGETQEFGPWAWVGKRALWGSSLMMTGYGTMGGGGVCRPRS